MKTASVRELRNQFPRLAGWLAEGETVQITNRGRPVAILSPSPPSAARKAALPDFLGRMEKLFPGGLPPEPGDGIREHEKGRW
jgi:antitoxin (DNA-binding transcriptional repressor) of toxin-antitoxin stability system